MQSLPEVLRSALAVPASLVPFAIGVLLAALVGTMLLRWAMRARVERRERLRCPVYRSMTRVVFGIAPDGTAIEVERCALLARRPNLACRCDCLATANEKAA